MIKQILALVLIVPSIGAMVDEVDRKTELIVAIKQNNSERVQELLDQGVDVNALCNHLVYGLTPLKCAARYGAPASAQLLLDAGALVDRAHDEICNSGSALHYACEYGHEQMVELLLNNNAEIDARNFASQTPLSCAAARGHFDIVRFLVAKGASVNPEARDGWHQCSYGSISFRLTSHSSPLSSAIRLYHQEMAQFLIEHGADVNHVLYKGKKLLELAYELGDNRMVLLLKNAGAILDHSAVPPINPGLLLEAAKNGSFYGARVLILAGMNLEEVDKGHQATPLIWAANNGHTLVCELLLKAGANVKAKNKDGKTALDCARENKHAQTVAFLERFVKQLLSLQQLCVNKVRRLYKEGELSESCLAGIQDKYEFDRVIVNAN